jgi:hypothetical protein
MLHWTPDHTALQGRSTTLGSTHLVQEWHTTPPHALAVKVRTTLWANLGYSVTCRSVPVACSSSEGSPSHSIPFPFISACSCGPKWDFFIFVFPLTLGMFRVPSRPLIKFWYHFPYRCLLPRSPFILLLAALFSWHLSFSNSFSFWL